MSRHDKAVRTALLEASIAIGTMTGPTVDNLPEALRTSDYLAAVQLGHSMAVLEACIRLKRMADAQ